MKHIDRLSEAQKARFPEWVEKWAKIGLSTEPADRPRFEAAIKVAYAKAKLVLPKKIIWVDSPLCMALAAPLAAKIIEHFGVKCGAVDTAVHDAILDAVHGAVHGAVDNAVDTAVRDAIRDAVHGAFGNAVCDAVDDAVRGAVGNAVGIVVDNAVGNAVRGAVGVVVRSAVDIAIHGAVCGAVDIAIHDVVGGAVGGAKKIILENWRNYIGGQFWAGGWYWGSPAYVSFFTDVCKLELCTDIQERATSYADLCSSAGWFWPHKEFVMVCERPAAIHLDATGRLHHESGPAFLCRDGWGFHAWHGIRVPSEIIEKPITLMQVQNETNLEIRRVMLERYGLDKYVHDAGLTEIQSDNFGRLFKLPNAQFPIVLVKNSTPESDGTFKNYVLTATRRDVKTAHEAVASTFGLTADQYHPVHES